MDGPELVGPTIFKQRKKMEQLGQSIKVVLLSWIGSKATLKCSEVMRFSHGNEHDVAD